MHSHVLSRHHRYGSPYVIRQLVVSQKQQECSRTIDTHQHCMSIAVVYQVTNTPRHVKSCWNVRQRMLVGMLTVADDISAHWNTRLFHWNTRANPSVPDQMCTQRPETHNAHIFSVI